MYEKICYKHNYLKKVICVMQFVSPIEELEKSMPKKINDVVKKHYPIAEPREIIGTELQINTVLGNSMVNKKISKQWVFISLNRQEHCIIDTEKISFVVSDYDKFDAYKEMVLEILHAVLHVYPEACVRRLGLRYQNYIPLNNHETWISNDYYIAVQKHLDERTTKLLTSLEYSCIDKGVNVRLQYGFYNPDYPALLKKREFLIDIDSHSTSIVYDSELDDLLVSMHAEIQSCFEKMITDEFREEHKS